MWISAETQLKNTYRCIVLYIDACKLDLANMTGIGDLIKVINTQWPNNILRTSKKKT